MERGEKTKAKLNGSLRGPMGRGPMPVSSEGFLHDRARLTASLGLSSQNGKARVAVRYESAHVGQVFC